MLNNGTYQQVYRWIYETNLLDVVPAPRRVVTNELFRVASENPTSGSLLAMNTATRDALLKEYGVSSKVSETLKIKLFNTGEEFEIVVFDGLPDMFIIRCEREIDPFWTFSSGTVTTTNTVNTSPYRWSADTVTVTWDEK